MEAIDIAIVFQQAVNRLRTWRGLSEHSFSRALYDRSFSACEKACQEDLGSTQEVVRHGYLQNVSRISYDMTYATECTQNYLLDSWIRRSPNICSAVLEYSFSGIAVVIRGTDLYIGISIAQSFSDPSMRHLNPVPILRRPKNERKVPSTSRFSPDDLHQIADLAHLYFNMNLVRHGCSVNFDDHLQRLAEFYSRETRDFGFMRMGVSKMARTVFEVDISQIPIQEIAPLVTNEILKRVRIEGDCKIAWGGIGLVEDGPKLWVGIVCYFQGLYH